MEKCITLYDVTTQHPIGCKGFSPVRKCLRCCSNKTTWYLGAHKTLGVQLAPDGNEVAQVDYLRSMSHQVSSLIVSSCFNWHEANIAYHMCWFTAVSYSLGMTTICDTDLISIQSHPTLSFLQKMGFNKHFPRAVTFGPPEFGGLALRHLPTEQGIAQITTFLDHVYHGTKTGRLIHTSQLEAGTKDLILANLTPSLQYLTNTWVTSIQDFIWLH